MIDKTINLDLLTVDSNAFAIMGRFRDQALREGWTNSEIEEVLKDARSGDYDHLLQVMVRYCEDKDEV